MQKKESPVGLFKDLQWKQNWQSAFRSRSFVIQGLVTLFATILVIYTAPPFLQFIQGIQGSYINDVLLNSIPAYDVSNFIFICLYVFVFVVIVQLSFHPVLALNALQAYLLLTVMRGCTIYLFPLEPHAAIVPLVDPLIDRFFYEQAVITKDLFFSGHVSTLSLLCFVTPSARYKRVGVGITFTVAILLLVQHAHYTIDVLAAPLAAWLAWKLAEKINR